MTPRDLATMNRRDLLKLGGGVLVASTTALRGTASAQQAPCLDGGPLYTEVHPTSPLILEPFKDPLPVPLPLRPSDPNDWTKPSHWSGASSWERPSASRQDCDYASHQIWPSQLGLPDPVYYRIQLKVDEHRFTSSKVRAIKSDGSPVTGADVAFGHPVVGDQNLPASTIYGFNGTFPGPMINARYGQPVSVRLENDLEANPLGLDRCDFGSPEFGFLTHLHNGHTACESDGNPNWRPQGYLPEQWCDNLYLNYPPDNDPNEKQSFLWFHDHYMHHTGANVYKGLVGLFPLYDPQLDPGDERYGLRLPGVPNASTGGVDYDIPLAFYDCAFDDGVTPHRDAHNGCGETHPEWWGKTFFRHLPNHGFVGDVFTTNCVAYPVLRVKRRKYRLRLLGASIARIYDFMFMSSSDGPQLATDSNPKKRQGQYRIRDGEQCLNFHEVATDGGLLPFALLRNSVEIWPAKRREIVVDFSKYMDGTPTGKDQVIWLVNIKQMTNGRKPNEAMMVLDNGTTVPDPDFEPGFCVPMLKIIIESDNKAADNSLTPTNLRPLPRINMKKLGSLPTRRFELQRGGTFGGETEWLINGEEFHPGHNLAFPKMGQPEVWTIKNGGGGWVHPMHLHFEEHRVITRNGIPTPLDPKHPDDNAREDVVALEPGEEVVIYRNFRTFSGPYVGHCHNLAHEDHNMMFGFQVQP
jgi:FtsP/CotA-like multicopper oxidase with cupredoxin domain